MYPNFLQAKAALAEGYAQLGMNQDFSAELAETPCSSSDRSVLWGEILWGYSLALTGRKR